jgi:predicted dehydrogenase
MALSGGQLVEQATHTIDMMRYLLGEIREVYTRRASRQLKETDCADTHVVSLEFESGALGSLTTTWAYDPADWSHANVIDISFDQSLLHLGGGKASVTQNRETRPLEAPDRGIDAVFVEAVRTANPGLLRSSYDDAVKSLAVTLAMNESADEGRPVRVASV